MFVHLSGIARFDGPPKASCFFPVPERVVAVDSRCGAAASLQEPNDELEEVRNGFLTAAAFNARISKNCDSVAEEYINELIRTLPHASAAAIYNCFHFTGGTMLA